MPERTIPEAGRLVRDRLLRLLLLVPAGAALILAGRLAGAAWSVNSLSSAALPDPLVEILKPGGGGGGGGPADLLDGAAEAAPLDYRYPARAGWWLWEEATGRAGGGATAGMLLLRAREEFLEAARRAPTVASVREGVWLTAAALGDRGLADEQAKAAVRLAPLDPAVCARAGRYLWARYREDRGRADLLHAAIRAMRHDPRRMAATFLEKAYDYEEVREDFARAGVPLREVVGHLVAARRWEWAIRAARELDGGIPGGGTEEARIHLDYARFLLGRRHPEGALQHLEDARALLGEAFRAWELLGRALLAAGRVKEGREALLRAREAGAPVPLLAGILRASAVKAADRASFWGRLVSRGDAPFEVRLEWAEALVASGGHARALPVLRQILLDDSSCALAHHLLALCFLEVGNRRIAAFHARRAADLDPGNEGWRALADRLAEEGKAK